MRATNGLAAIKRNAASPIVATKVAITALKLIELRTYIVITMIAPPQPGIAPRKAAINTSNCSCFFIKDWISKSFLCK